MYVRQCRAREERARIQKRNQIFRKSNPAMFSNPRKKVTCHKLPVDEEVITKKIALLIQKCWKDHFEYLSTSQSQSSESIPSLHAHSYGYNDEVLDTPFSVEEIECAVRKLKCGKGSGGDELQSEHLKYGGCPFLLWLQRIFNVIQLEDIPPCIKLGVIVPVFKGKGRDPLNPDNYRGITLTSVIANCLEIERLNSVPLEKGFPHQAQIKLLTKEESCVYI